MFFETMTTSNKDRDEQIEFLLKALYDIRLLLSHKMGDKKPKDKAVTDAANLAYALHNDVLAILRGESFNIDESIERVLSLNKVSKGNLDRSFVKRENGGVI